MFLQRALLSCGSKARSPVRHHLPGFVGIQMLRITFDDGRERTFALWQLPLTIGRAARVDIQVSDRFASRVHCELALVDGRVVVRDLHSRHGTLLNDVPVVEGVVHSGDRLQVGLTGLRVEVTPTACPQRVSAVPQTSTRVEGSSSSE